MLLPDQLLTDQISQWEAELEKERESLAELTTYGVPVAPIVSLDRPREYFRPDDYDARIERHEIRIAELETNIRDAKIRLKEKISPPNPAESPQNESKESGSKPRPTTAKAVEQPLFRPLTDDYRIIEYKGEHYKLGRKAAHAIKVLHEALKSGRPEMHQRVILSRIESKSEFLFELFKRGRAKRLWNTLIVRVEGELGVYRLDPEVES